MPELSDIVLRKAGSSDVESLAQMRWDMRVVEGGEAADLSRDDFIAAYCDWLSERQTSGRVVHIVAEQNGEILGTVALIPIEMLPRPCRFDDKMGYVTDFYVKPEFRNQGLGGQLLEKAREIGNEMDLELLTTWPSDDAARLYERHGFRAGNDILELTLRPY